MSTRISASIGIAMAPTDATDSAGVVWCADVAMYRAKLGNTPFALYAPDLDEGGNRLQLVEELRAAIDNGQLVLHYQPQLDLRSGEILAVEALLRWDHPQSRPGPAPASSSPWPKRPGSCGSITEFVLEQALAQCSTWRHSGRYLAVSVNISASNLLDDGFADLVRRLLEKYRLPADALVLELTETSIISEFDRSQAVIEELRGLGLVVSIDDFGAGFTSLAYLSTLAVGELKLDRTFIASLADRQSGRELELVRSTIDLGHALGLRVVAEGIEDRETLDLLSAIGCDLAQGYFISRPKAAQDLAFRSDPATARAAAFSTRAEPVGGRQRAGKRRPRHARSPRSRPDAPPVRSGDQPGPAATADTRPGGPRSPVSGKARHPGSLSTPRELRVKATRWYWPTTMQTSIKLLLVVVGSQARARWRRRSTTPGATRRPPAAERRPEGDQPGASGPSMTRAISASLTTTVQGDAGVLAPLVLGPAVPGRPEDQQLPVDGPEAAPGRAGIPRSPTTA